MQEPSTPSTHGVRASSGLALRPKKAEAGRGGGHWGGGRSAVWGAGRQHKTPVSFPPVSAWAGAPAGRSGVVLFTSPVDVLEEGHGEGHAQNLKDTGTGLRPSPTRGAHTGHLQQRVHTRVPDTRCWSEGSGEQGKAPVTSPGPHRWARPLSPVRTVTETTRRVAASLLECTEDLTL